MRNPIRAASLAAVAMLLTVIAAAPAAAIPPSTMRYSWLTCNPGTVTTGTLDSADATIGQADGRLWAHVGVTLAPCRQPSQLDAWGIGAYTGTSGYGRAVEYQQIWNTPPGHYSGSMKITTNVRALCVITDEETRLACIAVGWVFYDGVPVLVNEGSLPVDAPLVAMRAPTNMLVSQPIPPECSYCP